MTADNTAGAARESWVSARRVFEGSITALVVAITIGAFGLYRAFEHLQWRVEQAEAKLEKISKAREVEVPNLVKTLTELNSSVKANTREMRDFKADVNKRMDGVEKKLERLKSGR